jgi:hypothetical protein
MNLIIIKRTIACALVAALIADPAIAGLCEAHLVPREALATNSASRFTLHGSFGEQALTLPVLFADHYLGGKLGFNARRLPGTSLIIPDSPGVRTHPIYPNEENRRLIHYLEPANLMQDINKAMHRLLYGSRSPDPENLTDYGRMINDFFKRHRLQSIRSGWLYGPDGRHIEAMRLDESQRQGYFRKMVSDLPHDFHSWIRTAPIAPGISPDDEPRCVKIGRGSNSVVWRDPATNTVYKEIQEGAGMEEEALDLMNRINNVPTLKRFVRPILNRVFDRGLSSSGAIWLRKAVKLLRRTDASGNVQLNLSGYRLGMELIPKRMVPVSIHENEPVTIRTPFLWGSRRKTLRNWVAQPYQEHYLADEMAQAFANGPGLEGGRALIDEILAVQEELWENGLCYRDNALNFFNDYVRFDDGPILIADAGNLTQNRVAILRHIRAKGRQAQELIQNPETFNSLRPVAAQLRGWAPTQEEGNALVKYFLDRLAATYNENNFFNHWPAIPSTGNLQTDTASTLPPVPEDGTLIFSDTHGDPGLWEWAVALAKHGKLRKVIFAGDFFDRRERNIETWHLANELLACRPGIEVVYLLGNHDAYMVGSVLFHKPGDTGRWISAGGSAFLREAGLGWRVPLIRGLSAVRHISRTMPPIRSGVEFLLRAQAGRLGETTELRDVAAWLMENCGIVHYDGHGNLVVHEGFSPSAGKEALIALENDWNLQRGGSPDREQAKGLLNRYREGIFNVDRKAWLNTLADADSVAQILSSAGARRLFFGHNPQKDLFEGAGEVYGVAAQGFIHFAPEGMFWVPRSGAPRLVRPAGEPQSSDLPQAGSPDKPDLGPGAVLRPGTLLGQVDSSLASMGLRHDSGQAGVLSPNNGEWLPNVDLTDDEIKAYLGQKTLDDAKKEGRQFYIRRLDPTKDIHFIQEWERQRDADEEWIQRWEAKRRSLVDLLMSDETCDLMFGLFSESKGEKRLEGYIGFHLKRKEDILGRGGSWIFLDQIELYYRNIGSTADIPGIADLMMDVFIKYLMESGFIEYGITMYPMTPGSEAMADRWNMDYLGGRDRGFTSAHMQAIYAGHSLESRFNFGPGAAARRADNADTPRAGRCKLQEAA